MAKERTSVRMQVQIKVMSEQGHSIRRIARVLRLSRRTVRKYLETAPQPPSESGEWEEKIDWDYVRQEVYAKGTTVKQIGQEVAPEIAYVKFWRVFRDKAGLKASPEQVTIRLHHKPAEKTQIDFCDGLWISDRVSRNKTLTQFFLGVLQLLYLRRVCIGSKASHFHRRPAADVRLLWRLRGQVYYHSTKRTIRYLPRAALTRFIGWRTIRPTVVK
jgi:Homeodomain-like domain-containing protein